MNTIKKCGLCIANQLIVCFMIMLCACASPQKKVARVSYDVTHKGAYTWTPYMDESRWNLSLFMMDTVSYRHPVILTDRHGSFFVLSREDFGKLNYDATLSDILSQPSGALMSGPHGISSYWGGWSEDKMKSLKDIPSSEDVSLSTEIDDIYEGQDQKIEKLKKFDVINYDSNSLFFEKYLIQGGQFDRYAPNKNSIISYRESTEIPLEDIPVTLPFKDPNAYYWMCEPLGIRSRNTPVNHVNLDDRECYEADTIYITKPVVLRSKTGLEFVMPLKTAIKLKFGFTESDLIGRHGVNILTSNADSLAADYRLVPFLKNFDLVMCDNRNHSFRMCLAKLKRISDISGLKINLTDKLDSIGYYRFVYPM